MKNITKLLTVLILGFGAAAMHAANYYWVGGGGKWSDLNHWRTTSGGTAYPSVVPSQADDVFFDANSGFTAASNAVAIDVSANCRNITFSGSAVAPSVMGQTLNIYGSSVWQTGMQIAGGTFYYRNTGVAKTITSNGVAIGASVYLEESSSVSILDDLNIAGTTFAISAGTFNTNDFKLTLNVASFLANSSTAKTLNLGSSQIFMTSYQGNMTTESASTVVNAGTSAIHFTGENSGYGLKAYGGQTFYDLSFENTSGSAAISGGTSADPVKFHSVSFAQDAKITGYNNFDSLVLAQSKSYTFQANAVQKVQSRLAAGSAQCGAWVSLSSSANGSAAIISASSTAVIDVQNAVIKDIAATGGAGFNAARSVDAGGNSGWNFLQSTAQNLYWVGGAGNWDDTAHWSAQSGGTGGYCVPGPTDNVFFDAGSGFTSSSYTITINNIAYTHNITFSGSACAPALQSTGTQVLNIYGSSEWQSGQRVSVYTIYYRNTGEDKTIKSNNVTTGGNVILEESASVSMLDNYNASNIKVSAGIFNTNNFVLRSSGDFTANSGKPTTLNLGSSVIYLNNAQASWNTSNSSTTVNAGTSAIHFTALYYNSSGLVAAPGQRYYDVFFDYAPGDASISGGNDTAPVTFHNVEFAGKGYINGTFTYDNLRFAVGKSYVVMYGDQKILNSFSASAPSCAGWITITSYGTGARIVAAAGTNIDVRGVIMSGIGATGGADFVAANSIDAGSNPGWTFPAYSGRNLYWVNGGGNWSDKLHWSATSGGTGNFCIPGPMDNVFFDENSGFYSGGDKVFLDTTAYVHNITFRGSAIPPKLSESLGYTGTMNIYGSSEWQNGMGYITVAYINYVNTGEPKTIKSNGVIFSSRYINIGETTSTSMIDALSTYGGLMRFVIGAGTFNTNNNALTVNGNELYVGGNNTKLNLGSSDVYISTLLNIASQDAVNAGNSVIHFTGYNPALQAIAGVKFNDVRFENGTAKGIIRGGSSTYPLLFHSLYMANDGEIDGFNTFDTLQFEGAHTYLLQAGTTQKITNWQPGGTPCAVTVVKSTQSGSRAGVNVVGGNTAFNFANLKDIDAVGAKLNFGEQSTDAGNNNNIVFATYKPGAFEGLGPDRPDAVIDSANPATYTLGTSSFYGNNTTAYKWYKLNDAAYNPETVISTAPNIDIRNFGGYGTYKVVVSYTGSSATPCTVDDSVIIGKAASAIPAAVYANPQIRWRIIRQQ